MFVFHIPLDHARPTAIHPLEGRAKLGIITDTIKQALGGLIRAIFKAQRTESGDVTININIGNHYYQQTLPQAAVDQIQSSGVTPQRQVFIEEEAEYRLSAQHPKIDSLPEPERTKLIAGVTTEATIAILVPDTGHMGQKTLKSSNPTPPTGEDK